MNTAQQRNLLKTAYKGKRWAEKVSKMSNSQVVAVYLRLKRIGKL